MALKHAMPLSVCLSLTSLMAMSEPTAGSASSYDPLALTTSNPLPPPLDLTATRIVGKDLRQIPIRVYQPRETSRPAPVILFSHGLGGSRENSSYLGNHWAARGYVVVAIQHTGSDTAAWRNVPIRDRMASMRRAASTGNLRLRLDDVPAVLDQLERWNTEVTHPLQGRLDLNRVGMSGHSFGAMTTQGVSGMTFPFWGNRATDSRIRAALVMSPSTSQAISPEKSFSKVRIPWMVMTGTRDSSIIIRTDPEDRLRVFDSLPLGNKYQLVFKDGEHMAFSEQSLPMDGVKKNPNHHRAILALSTAFWDAYLGQNAEAHGWLDGQGPRSILQTGDQWDRK